MLEKSPKYRRPLSKSQIGLLKLVYKFRFVSTDLLAEAEGKDRSTVYECLYVLEKQGYIAKRYDKTYRLAGKPASYFLTSKAISLLRKDEDLSEKSLRNMYKNKHLATNETYIAHCLSIMGVYNALQLHYAKTFDIYTKFELSDYDFFPRPLPDLFLKRDKPSQTKCNGYMLDIFHEDTLYWLRRKRIKTYMEHIDSGEWDAVSSADYPSLLFVTPNEKVQARALKEAEYGYDRYFVDEDKTGTLVVTQEALMNRSKEVKVWRGIYKDEDEEVERISL